MNSKKSQVYSYIDRQFIECMDHFDNEESLLLLGFVECAKMVEVIDDDEYEFLNKCENVIMKGDCMLQSVQQESLVKSSSLLHMLNNL